MGKVNFTEKQQKVIDARNVNLLVSAAAGSGKTAVLTERIISLITDPEQPVDIDRLLVVTFTKAAAAEMRERIGRAIDERLGQNPEDRNLLRQMALLHNAQITTIDSFCLFLIRNNFGDIGLDPGFRIMEEGERKLLMKDTMDELLEEYYQKKENEEFFFLTECYGGNGQDLTLVEIVISLYHFALSHPYPEEWLKEAASGYLAASFEELEERIWWKSKTAENDKLIERLLLLADEAVGLCRETDGPAAYLGTMEAQRKLLAALRENKEFGMRYRILCHTEIPKLGRVKKTDDKELCNQVKGLRDRIKEGLAQLADCYYDTPEHIFNAVRETKTAAKSLICLTKDFMERFALAKRERNVLDFSDMEHFALDILVGRNEEGDTFPTKAAKEYQEYFAYVMVDEYQDSNYVQEFLLKSIAKENNYFMVGDVKQSIYRFRLARPEIFMEKYASFQEDRPDAGKNIRIDLNRNFRSRKEVLDSVNDVFSVIMTAESVGMDYDDKVKLYPGADYPQGTEALTELVLIEKPEEEDKKEIDNTKELEALYVAGRIKEMMRQGFSVTDQDSKTLRSVSYGDIVILMRSMDGYGEVFRNVLETQGIPVYSNTKTGYFSTLEVRTVMNILQVLDNPRQDIPLYGMMTSFVGGFTEGELADIRAGINAAALSNKTKRGKCLYDVVREYETAALSDNHVLLKKNLIQKKIAHLTELIDQYRKKAKYTGIRELLEDILGKTGYLDYVTALPGGKQRRANLMMLLERAADFEKTSYSGLFHFVRYINQLKEQEVDYGEAGMPDEHADVVRIMTIHKSKGLEFPVCFLCGMGKRMNKRDISKPVLLDSEYGIGLDNMNPLLRIKRPCLQKKVIAEKILTDSIAEEMRILYVAMTRAKEKLIMTGTVNNLEKTAEKWQQPGAFDPKELRQYTSYLDFLLAAYESSNKTDQYVTEKTAKDILAQLKMTEVETCMDREVLRNMELLPEGAWENRLEERFSAKYPYPELAGLYTKTTVSELKKAAYEDTKAYQMFDTQRKEAYIPKFLRKDQEPSLGTKRGTAVHRILELITYKKLRDAGRYNGEDTAGEHLKEYVRHTLEDNISAGKMKKEEADLVNTDKCVLFLQSSLARRMAEADFAGKLFKEKSFFIGIPANEIKEEFPQNETVLVQGVIDVYFEEEDGLVLADYKTDRVSEAQELRDRYHIQLNLYARALEQITGKKVKEKWIYSFALACEIPV